MPGSEESGDIKMLGCSMDGSRTRCGASTMCRLSRARKVEGVEPVEEVQDVR